MIRKRLHNIFYTSSILFYLFMCNPVYIVATKITYAKFRRLLSASNISTFILVVIIHLTSDLTIFFTVGSLFMFYLRTWICYYIGVVAASLQLVMCVMT